MTNSSSRWLETARNQWTHTGAKRPPFAADPGPGQESVWDYPRPPVVVPDGRLVEVIGEVGVIAASRGAIRVLETSHPPSFYLPPESITDGALFEVGGRSHCEWKGEASYVGESPDSQAIGWRYPKPYPEFERWANYVSFYPDRVECRVDGELVRPQLGGFYGGWITGDIVGPFKGEAGASSSR